MYPVIFRIGTFEVTSFGVLVAVEWVAGTIPNGGRWPRRGVADSRVLTELGVSRAIISLADRV